MDRLKNYWGHFGHSKEQSLDMPRNELKVIRGEKGANIDIVFLPRPGAQVLAGWTAKDPKGHDVIWPEDFLGKDIPNARILAYGYHESANPNYKTDAKHLCGKLKELRVGVATTPIVLVAHSLGGILSAKVMIDGDPSISGCVQGLAFFGTPFQASNSSGLPNILGRIMKLYGPSKDDFKDEIETLKQLSDKLSSTSHENIKLTSFCEENGGLVDINAVKIPGVHRHRLSAIGKDHDNICKFESRKPWYENVRDELRILARVETTEGATSKITNHGNIGNFVDGGVEGGLHNGNTGTVSYGNNYYDGDQSRGFESASGGKPGKWGGTR